MKKEEPIYILKIGKMYLQAIYVKDEFPLTHYVNELEFSNNTNFIYDSAKFKTNLEAEYTKDILKELLGYNLDTIEIIEIHKETEYEGDSDE